jgi:NAD(P)-dependent dehydrogenase (short-subunit alcohol dehydrogenase family)
VTSVDLDDWDRVMAANVTSVVLMSGHAIRHMGGGGAIANLSSIAAERPPTGGASYVVSTSAIEALTRSIAHDRGPAGIRANCVRPGELATWRVLDGLDQAQAEALRTRVRSRSVLGTVGSVGTSPPRSRSSPPTTPAGSPARC